MYVCMCVCVCVFVFIQDDVDQLTVVTDRSQGGGSIYNGSLEIMVRHTLTWVTLIYKFMCVCVYVNIMKSQIVINMKHLTNI